MKVILLMDVKGQGKKGDVIEVNDTYARNFLLPKKLGEQVTKQKEHELEQKRKSLELKKSKEIQEKQEMARALNLATVTVRVRTGGGAVEKIFGSVGQKQVQDALSEMGYAIDRKDIVIDEPIKQLGRYTIELKIISEIKCRINLVVVKEE